MKRLPLFLGIILVVLGVIGLVHPSFNYHQKEEVGKSWSLQSNRGSRENRAGPACGIDRGSHSRHNLGSCRIAHEIVTLPFHTSRLVPVGYLSGNSTITSTPPQPLIVLTSLQRETKQEAYSFRPGNAFQTENVMKNRCFQIRLRA